MRYFTWDHDLSYGEPGLNSMSYDWAQIWSFNSVNWIFRLHNLHKQISENIYFLFKIFSFLSISSHKAETLVWVLWFNKCTLVKKMTMFLFWTLRTYSSWWHWWLHVEHTCQAFSLQSVSALQLQWCKNHWPPLECVLEKNQHIHTTCFEINCTFEIYPEVISGMILTFI